MAESDTRCVGEAFSGCDREEVVFSEVAFVGLSSGVGVDIGELVS